MSHDPTQLARAQYGVLRGGILTDICTSEALSDDSMDNTLIGDDATDIVATNSTSSSSPRHVRFPPAHYDNYSSGTSSAIQSLTSASTLDSKLELSPSESVARKGLLRDSFFDQWKDDAGSADLGSPEEMQKRDPLGTQIWKLYSKTKGQLPNSERLENLSWRMMSMNLRKKELERQG